MAASRRNSELFAVVIRTSSVRQPFSSASVLRHACTSPTVVLGIVPALWAAEMMSCEKSMKNCTDVKLPSRRLSADFVRDE